MGLEGDEIPMADGSPSDDYSVPSKTVEFDAVEHPLELEHHSEVNLGDGVEQDEDGYGSDDSESKGEGEGEGEAEYMFQFQGDMDPLSFAEEQDAPGLLPYQRFERLHNQYEVLAAKKRPALQQCISDLPAKRLRVEEDLGATFEEIMETMNYGSRKKSRKANKRGRRKGSKSKVNPEVSQKLRDAKLSYACLHYEEAINALKEVIRLAPNLVDPYRTLGLIYSDMNDKKKALNCYIIAAQLAPKDASLWKLLCSWSIEQGNKRQANYCLNKAIIADPEDIGLRSHRASLYVELGEYLKAAESYEQISRLCPDDIEILRNATKLYQRCGQCERAACMLEGILKNHTDDANFCLVDLLASVLLDNKAYSRALEHIERVQHECKNGKEIPPNLMIKAGICHVFLGNLKKAEDYFSLLKSENASAHDHLIMDVADSLMTVGEYESALTYYLMIVGDAHKYNGDRHLRIARCCVSLKKVAEAIEYYYKAIEQLDNTIDARLMLSSLLLEVNRDNEAISVLSPPVESAPEAESNTCNFWWLSGKIKLKLSLIYKAKGLFQDFVDVLFPIVRETLFLETVRKKVKPRKRLSKGVLSERMKILNDQQSDTVFHRFRPVASAADLSKASRAKRLLEKKAAEKEARRAAGIDWESDDSDDESPRVLREPPLPDLLKEGGDHYLIVDLCKALSTLRKYWDALEIINLSLKLECNTLSAQVKEELRTLGAQMAHNISDPTHGWECVRYFVSRHPFSFSAWNCYYKGLLRSNRMTKHNKFLHSMRAKHKDCVQPILISGHHFTMISQHQAAAREYLEAYKLLPDSPLINLCVGTALINLALGHRLPNKHQAILQGLAFLHNNARLCGDSQESFYNIARACHHVGLVSLAVTYYEKVLAMREKDYPIPVLPNDNPDYEMVERPGYCDLRREAAYNLHLIYKRSGAVDLARQVLKDHVVL
ncbi:uncharacterized protein LOC127263720 [Andrographis paniculata]|uniref:uncharacterized protein LOC127263720 n=1 Tax=Andrographis paniculata TaxID=175694 RepID=UPI0021E8749C|nr:uncharacterized protein LOC127263720 [Andrographis paniculata]XP_051148861.1 uncharacterized protein LOC127263720 [Andrographis paniculata]XP_051148862.1 uncharacterized protein LOC127263720 [Andrographis paniculata]